MHVCTHSCCDTGEVCSILKVTVSRYTVRYPKVTDYIISRPAEALLPACWRISKILLEIGSFWSNNAGGSNNYFQNTTFDNIHF